MDIARTRRRRRTFLERNFHHAGKAWNATFKEEDVPPVTAFLEG